MSANIQQKAQFLGALAADGEVSATAKVVAIALVLRFLNGKTGRCNPAYDTLGQASGIKRRATINAVHELEAAGWIIIEKRVRPGRSQTNNFRLALERTAKRSDGGPVDPWDEADKVHGDALIPGKGCTKTYERVRACAPEPLKNPPGSNDPGGDSPFPPMGSVGPGGVALRQREAQVAFREWRKQYPKRKVSKAAETAYVRIVTAGEASPADLLAGAIRYASERYGEDSRFTKNPDTWLTKGCWNDEPGEPIERSDHRRRGREVRMDGYTGFTAMAIDGIMGRQN